MNVCVDMYYAQMYYTCQSMRGVLVGDKSVLLEVNSREDGSECYVFIGTMIHINDLSALPYSPFILFSSLPFDIPVRFHSPNTAYYVQKASEKYGASLRK